MGRTGSKRVLVAGAGLASIPVLAGVLALANGVAWPARAAGPPFLARPAPAARAVPAAPATPAATPTPGPHSGLRWDQRPCTTPARQNAGECRLGVLTLETSRFLPEDELEELLAARGLRSRALAAAAPTVWLDQLEPLDRAERRRHLSEPGWRHPAAERWERALAAPIVARVRTQGSDYVAGFSLTAVVQFDPAATDAQIEEYLAATGAPLRHRDHSSFIRFYSVEVPPGTERFWRDALPRASPLILAARLVEIWTYSPYRP